MSIDALIVILIGIVVGASGQIAYLFLIDHEMMKASKGKIKEMQQQMKQFKPGTDEFKQVYSQLMAENSKMMKQSFKPTYVTFIPFIIIFLIMSSYLSAVPMGVGSNVQMIMSGAVNGTLTFSNGCITLDNSSNITVSSTKLPQTFTAQLNSATCTAFLSQSGSVYNASISGLVGSHSKKSYTIGDATMKFSPNPVIVATLPFSIPLIGKKVTWFWGYVFFSFVTSIALNRVFKHYKMIS